MLALAKSLDEMNWILLLLWSRIQLCGVFSSLSRSLSPHLSTAIAISLFLCLHLCVYCITVYLSVDYVKICFSYDNYPVRANYSHVQMFIGTICLFISPYVSFGRSNQASIKICTTVYIHNAHRVFFVQYIYIYTTSQLANYHTS